MDWKKEIFEKWGKLSKGRSEDMECAAFVAEIRRAILEDQFTGIFLHIPNEEIDTMKPQTALIKKIIGKIPGAPDYLFIGQNHAFFIEMKATNGKQSKRQKIFQNWCEHSGVAYHLCFSAAEALHVLKRNNVLFDP